MEIRALSSDDAEALRTLWNQSATFDVLTPALLQENVWADADFDPELALVAVADQRLAGFGLGIFRPDNGIGYVKMMAVHPDFRRKAIGSALLAQLEPLLFARGASEIRIGEAPPNYLVAGIDTRYTPAVVFFERNGYLRFHEGYNLHCDLEAEDWATEAEEAQLAARGITIARALPEDEPAVMDFLAQHFKAWQPEVGKAFLNQPVSLHLAWKDRKIVAFSAYNVNNQGLPWFGPMGTDPTQRGLGAGGVLLRRCLRDQKAEGFTYSIIPWVGPYPFYAYYCGAWIERVFWRYHKMRPD